MINEFATAEKQCTVVNKYKDEFYIYIGRGSRWGNPFRMSDESDEERYRVCDIHETYFLDYRLTRTVMQIKRKTTWMLL